MVRIRLRRVGLKKQPSYRIVVADRESPRNGKYLEIIGTYNPRTVPTTVELKEDRALYWLSVGAQPSEPVVRILKWTGTDQRLERLRKGEPIETLVAEAAVEKAKQPSANPKTRRLAPTTKAERLNVEEGAENA
ncbi:MAG: 30S ribosomal protein S16 [Aggregatilineales bacterium]